MWTKSISTTSLPDDQLLLRRYVRDYDLSAFDALAHRYLDLIRNSCRQEIANTDLAEDAVSATLLVFAEKAHSIRSDASLGAWLTKTSRLIAKNVRRREESQVNRAKRLRPDNPWITESAVSLALDQALSNLTERYRTALTLRFGEQQSLAEVGRALGISEDAARMTVQRGLKQIRKTLKGAGISVGIASTSLLLRQQTYARSGRSFGWPLRTSALNVALGSPLIVSPVALASISAIIAIPLAVWHPVYASIQSRHAQSVVDESSLKLAPFKSFQADLEMNITLNGKTFSYASKIMAQRPDLYRADTNSPYFQRVVCDGRTVYTLSAIGTPNEGYTKFALAKLHGSSTPAIDAFLGWDVLKNMSQFLVGVSPKIKPDDPIETKSLPDEKVKGKSYRVVEILHSKSDASIKLYFAPSGIIEREEARVQVLYTEDDGHGNRQQRFTTETFSASLKNVRLGSALPAETFAFDESKYRSLIQPDLATVDSTAPDFTGANPLNGQSIHLNDVIAKNKATLLDFWFAGCAPCRAEMPKLGELQTRHASKGLTVLCINGMDNSDVIKSIFEKEHLSMTPVLAPMRRWGGMDQCAWDYGVRAYPTQFLLNSKGRIVWVGHGLDAGFATALSDLGVD